MGYIEWYTGWFSKMCILYGHFSMGLAPWWLGVWILDQQAMVLCHTAWLGPTVLHLTRVMSSKGEINSYPAFCEDLWDLGREAISRKRWAECRVVDRVGFIPFHLDIWVPLLACSLCCVWVCVCLFCFGLALKVPGSFANSCRYSLTLRASLTDSAWS